ALDENLFALPGGFVFLQDFVSKDVRRHEVGRELYAVERQVERVGETFHQGGLGHSRRPDEQDVAAGEQGDEKVLDQGFIADDDLGDLDLDLGENVRGIGHDQPNVYSMTWPSTVSSSLFFSGPASVRPITWAYTPNPFAMSMNPCAAAGSQRISRRVPMLSERYSSRVSSRETSASVLNRGGGAGRLSFT